MNNFREVFQKYAAVVFFDTKTSRLDENDTVYGFEELLDSTARPVLLAAHNAQFTGTVVERYVQPCANLLEHVNIFGYNPKYGVVGRLAGVTYWSQRFNKCMQSLGYTLLALAKKGAKA